MANIRPLESSERLQEKLAADAQARRARLAPRAAARSGAIEAAISNYELAFKMQSAVPELMELSGEGEATKAALRRRLARP